MHVIKNEHIIAFDVDNTLIMWNTNYSTNEPGRIEIEAPGYGNIFLTPHYQHIHFLKNSKHRGYYVIVWSNGGVDWAETVIKKLGLEEYVDLVLTKPGKVVDDEPIDQTLKNRIYLNYRYLNEEWRDIINYEGLYQVSNYGRIKSLSNGSDRTERIKSLSTQTGGYHMVTLSKNRKAKNCLVHRLVAEAFLQNTNNYKIVNHIDHNRQNNCIFNLEWTTSKENNSKEKSRRRNLRGSERSVKLTEDDAKYIYDAIKNNISKTELAKKYNVSFMAIHNIGIKKTWKHIHEEA